MSPLYPFKFKTIFKDKIWGGSKIKSHLGKDFAPLPNCGETWEVSGVKGNISEVANGALEGRFLTELIEQYKGTLLGERVYSKFGNEFPLLIKFIDANQDLSIQVHPHDAMAKERHNSFGKTEMWYIMQADEGAKLVSGFQKEIDKETYLEHFNSGRLYDILNQEEAVADDFFYLPAGRVHTIGKGLLLAEIQQTSDVTYRIYDFDRKDDQGNTRELHVEQALDAIDYKYYDDYKGSYEKQKDAAVELVESPYFKTNKLDLTKHISRDYSGLDSFVILIGLEGSCELEWGMEVMTLSKGDSMLIPASIKNLNLVPKGGFKCLETWVP